MPDDLQPVRELLPTWVHWSAWLATPVMTCVVAFVFTLLVDAYLRPHAEGLHWTERARLHFASNRAFSALVMTQIVFCAMNTGTSASGILIGDWAAVRVAATLLLAWLLVLPVRVARARRVDPSITVRRYLSGFVFLWVVFYPFVVIAAGMALFGPAGWGGHEWSFVLVFGGGLLMIAQVLRGGHMVVARWLGIVRPADDRTRAIVAEAARRSGHTPARSWIGRTPMANAAALPSSNEVLVTDRALEMMTDEQLVAIMLHEFGHLKESKKSQATRFVGLLFLIAVAMWRPLSAWFTVYGLLAILVVCLLLAIRVAGAIQKMESEADTHAHEHGDDDGELYARSLERLHEVNLVPAVMAGTKQSHPHLYDRMLAAGVTPDYERPEPPPKGAARFLLFAVLSIALYVTESLWLKGVRKDRDNGPDRVMLDFAWTGGDVDSLGELGFDWETTHPDKAEVMLRAAVPRTDWPAYPLLLARILIGKDADEAREFLQRAERELETWSGMDEWFRATVDEVRTGLGMPAKVW